MLLIRALFFAAGITFLGVGVILAITHHAAPPPRPINRITEGVPEQRKPPAWPEPHECVPVDQNTTLCTYGDSQGGNHFRLQFVIPEGQGI